MPEHFTMRTAAGELGLTPPQLELARQLAEVRTVRGEDIGRPGGAPGGQGDHWVPREEVERLKAQSGFPGTLRMRLTVVGPAKGAELLGIAQTRFTRLARGGCFSPVRFCVNRYRAVVWLYLAAELREFAERRPELLRGKAPRGLRVLLGEGRDLRPMHWRGRWVEQFSRQAAGPWGRAGARAAVLDRRTVEETVPDAGERARLSALRPELVATGYGPGTTREVVARLSVADAEDEILLHRLLLAAELDEARAADARAAVRLSTGLSGQEVPGKGESAGEPAAAAPEETPPESLPVPVSVPVPAVPSPSAAAVTAAPEKALEGTSRADEASPAPALRPAGVTLRGRGVGAVSQERGGSSQPPRGTRRWRDVLRRGGTGTGAVGPALSVPPF